MYSEEEVFEYIKSKLPIGFELAFGPAAYVDRRRVVADAVLYKDNNRIAVFEFCKMESDVKNVGHKQEGLMLLALKYNVPYAIICDTDDAYVIDVYGYNDKGYVPDFMRTEEALNLLFSADDSEHPISEYYAERVLEGIKKAAEKSGLEDESTLLKLNGISLNYVMQHAFQVDLYHSVFLDADFEQKLFSILLRMNNDIKSVCRYTTLNSALRIIDSKKNSLCSIVCMNDKSECYYVDKYLYDNAPEKLSEMSAGRIAELNSNFIMSCSDIKMKDDLTMWRMYGDEAKGVCMEYSVDNDIAAHHFFLAPVSYARQNDSHPELDFVKELQQYELKKYRLIFRTIDIWKHFFKPANYASENEIRLLYVEMQPANYKWIQTSEPILAPVVEFGIGKTSPGYFPLQLKGIMLGPKCVEKDTNSAQMKYRIDLQQLKVTKDFNVSMSKIDNYR